MKKRKITGLLSALFLAAAAMMLPVTPAYAAEASGSVDFVKAIDMTDAPGATVPNATYSYSIAAGTAAAATDTTLEIKAGVMEGVSITPTAAFTSADTIVGNAVSKDITVTFTNVNFPSAGIYRYVITETDPSVAGLTTDGENSIYLDVYVLNDGEGLKIGDYQFTTSNSAPDTDGDYETSAKLEGDTDTYETYSLTVQKAIAGDLADMTAKFSIDVDFSNLSDGTKLTVGETQTDPAADGAVSVNAELGNGGTVTITGIPADADYAVVENLLSSQGYTVTATVDNADQTVQYANGEYSFAQQEMDATNHAVIVTNTKTAVSPTGIIRDIAPYALLVVAAAGACVIFLRKRTAE